MVQNDFIEKEWLKNSFKIETVQTSLNESELETVQTILRENIGNNNTYNILQPQVRIATTLVIGFEQTAGEITLDNGATYDMGIYHLYEKGAQCYRYSSGDYTDEEKITLDLDMVHAHPNWTYRGCATKAYNCHSYVWIDDDVTNIYWLNSPRFFMNSTSYFSVVEISDITSSGEYYIVLYKNNSIVHSLRLIGRTSTDDAMQHLWCISKLGSSGLYETNLRDIYNMYQATEYVIYEKIN